MVTHMGVVVRRGVLILVVILILSYPLFMAHVIVSTIKTCTCKGFS